MTFEIVPMTEQHIERAAALERECFSAPWSENSLREELSNEQSHFLCAMSNGSFAGYVGVQEIAGEAYITNVAVFPEYRHRGAGKELLTAAERGASERGCSFITLEVRAGNSAAASLYRKLGYRAVGIRRNFYTCPKEDAVIMTKNLTDEEKRTF